MKLPNISSKVVFIVLVCMFTLIIVLFSLFISEYKEITNQAEISLEQVKEINKRAQNLANNNKSELKTYRNEEWGFEFMYPKDLVILEDAFKSYYSKFNLKILTKVGEQFDPTFLVNIVLPEFAERSFTGLEKITTRVNIDGVSGIQYEYEFGGRREIAIILPINKQYQLILGVYYKEYEGIFNQILATFKFLK